MLDRVIFYGMLVLLVLTSIPYGTVEPWSEALFECTVFVFCILWLIKGALSGSWRINGLWMLYPLIALVVFSLVQSYELGQSDIGGSGVRAWL